MICHAPSGLNPLRRYVQDVALGSLVAALQAAHDSCRATSINRTSSERSPLPGSHHAADLVHLVIADDHGFELPDLLGRSGGDLVDGSQLAVG